MYIYILINTRIFDRVIKYLTSSNFLKFIILLQLPMTHHHLLHSKFQLLIQVGAGQVTCRAAVAGV